MKIQQHKSFTEVVQLAGYEAESRNQQLDTLHLALALLNSPNISAEIEILLKKSGLSNIETFKANLLHRMSMLEPKTTKQVQQGMEYFIRPTKELAQAFSRLERIVLENEQEMITPELFIIATLSFNNNVSEIIEKTNIDKETLIKNCFAFSKTRIAQQKKQEQIQKLKQESINFFGKESMQEPETTIMTEDDIHQATIEKFTINLNEQAKEKKLPPLFGRIEEISLLTHALSKKQKNNALLYGLPGVGKTAIVEGFVQRIITGAVPNNLKEKTVLLLNTSALIAGAKYRGEFEERVGKLLQALIFNKDKYILFIDEFHQIMGLGSGGSEGAMDMSSMLKPALARNQISIIGATTDRDIKIFLEKDSATMRRFQTIKINEPTEAETLSILRGIKDSFQEFHNLVITDKALKATVQLSSRFITDRQFPDKAIDVIDHAAALVKIELDSGKPERITKLIQEIQTLKAEAATLEKQKETVDEYNEITQQIKALDEEREQLEGVWFYQMSKKFSAKELDTMLAEAQKSYEENLSKNNLSEAARFENDILIRLNKIKDVKKNHKKHSSNKFNKEIIFRNAVTEDEISEVISRLTGIKLSNISANEKEKVLSLEKNMGGKVIGQERAVKALSSAVRRAKSGLVDPNKPLSTLLFLGPTGVGKTELVKVLSRELFNGEKDIVRFDMSEFGSSHHVSRLVGTTPGYIGYEEGGQLTEAVKKNPHSIILLDEIEKAHPSIFNILLQVLSDGDLTDGKGNKVNFKNTIIIMTSNLGAKELQKAMGDGPKQIGFASTKSVSNMSDDKQYNEIKKVVMPEVKKFFLPEILNRIDDIIIFKPLTTDDIKKVVSLEVDKVLERSSKMDIDLTIDPTVIEYIANKGYDKLMGARPVKRFIEAGLVSFLGDKILEDKIKKGEHYHISIKDDVYQIS